MIRLPVAYWISPTFTSIKLLRRMDLHPTLSYVRLEATDQKSLLNLAGHVSMEFQLAIAENGMVTMPCGTCIPMEGILRIAADKRYKVTVVTRSDLEIIGTKFAHDLAALPTIPLNHHVVSDLCVRLTKVRGYLSLFAMPGHPTPLLSPVASTRADAVEEVQQLIGALMKVQESILDAEDDYAMIVEVEKEDVKELDRLITEAQTEAEDETRQGDRAE